MNEVLLEIPNVEEGRLLEVKLTCANGKELYFKVPLVKVCWTGTCIPRDTPFWKLPWFIKKRLIKNWVWGNNG
jgi:hypothetical protein